MNTKPTPKVREIQPWAKRIKRLLEERCIEQQELAAAVGLSKSAISQWFVGATREPSAHVLAKTADFFKTTPTWILRGDPGVPTILPGPEAATPPAEHHHIPPAISERHELILALFDRLTEGEQMEELYRLHNIARISIERGAELIRQIESDVLAREIVTGNVRTRRSRNKQSNQEK